MRICLAQIEPVKGDIDKNIELHRLYIERATDNKAELIVFPELSLTSYEPEIAKELATDINDPRFTILQKLSDERQISIMAGLPTNSANAIRISMIILQPDSSPILYSKQIIHEDEKPYFTEGYKQEIITFDNTKIAPAICYESLQPSHISNAIALGADIYIASVAKPERGMEKALEYFPAVAKQYNIPILLVNSVGFCDNFMSVGKSSVWSEKGDLLAQLDSSSQGMLICETTTNTASKIYLD